MKTLWAFLKTYKLYFAGALILAFLLVGISYGMLIHKYGKMNEKEIAAAIIGDLDKVQHYHTFPFAFEAHFYLTRRSPEDVEALHKAGGHILWMGAFNRHPGMSKRIAKFYMQRGMDINKPVPHIGMNALHWVSNGNLAEAAQWLLENGADPTIKKVVDPEDSFDPYGAATALEMVREKARVHKAKRKQHRQEIEGLWDETLAVLEAYQPVNDRK